MMNLAAKLQDYPADDVLCAINKYLAEQDFSEFCRQAWPHVEPGRNLVWGWHLQAKCDHLQAVYAFTVPPEIDPIAKNQIGIQSLIINEPPRCSKSLFTSVLFPAWVWTRWPGARFLCITYAEDLAERDALKCRQLLESDWYQSRWPGRTINSDQSAKKRYNIGSHGGFRVSTTILGMATGEGGDFRIIDDPHNVKKALSDTERKQANTFFDLTLPTRVVDPERSSTIICMQRLHQDDLTGHALSGGNPWDILCLPMEYEARKGNQCSTALDFIDPRSEDGELLHPERWTRKAVEKAKNDLRMELGDFGVDSQFQQQPTPLGGGMFKPDNLVMVNEWPSTNDLDKIVRYWDKAATSGSGCYTSGALMAKNKITQRTIILDIVRGQWDTDDREAHIQATAYQDCRRLGISPGNGKYAVRVEQEPGSGGKDSAQFTVKGLAGFNIKAIRKTKSKEVDWLPLSAMVNAGAVEMIEGPWNKETKDEMKNAPFGKYKDDLDALAGGFAYIWLSKETWVA
jgi:predicted phage terminase large subunit-like protein